MPAVVAHPVGSASSSDGGGRGRGPACLDVNGHVGAVVLDSLEGPDRLSELHPFPAVGRGGLEGPLGHTRGVGSGGKHPEGEHPVEQCGGGGSGWAQQVVRRHDDPIEGHREQAARLVDGLDPLDNAGLGQRCRPRRLQARRRSPEPPPQGSQPGRRRARSPTHPGERCLPSRRPIGRSGHRCRSSRRPLRVRPIRLRHHWPVRRDGTSAGPRCPLRPRRQSPARRWRGTEWGPEPVPSSWRMTPRSAIPATRPAVSLLHMDSRPSEADDLRPQLGVEPIAVLAHRPHALGRATVRQHGPSRCTELLALVGG